MLSSANLTDLSFAGSKVNLSMGSFGPINIENFMDDANPLEFQDTEVSGVGVNCNGHMIRYAKPNVVMMSVTVMPSSNTDNALYNAWKRYRVQDGNNMASQWETPCTVTITLANTSGQVTKRSYTLSGGTMVSGPGGPTSSADGKMQGRTYTFAFAKVD